MRRSLHGKRAILTGASGGIGQALARALVRAGVNVALASRNSEKLNTLAQELDNDKVSLIVIPCDITVAEDRQRLVDTTVERWGGIDLLINNAGIGSWGHFIDSTEEICRKVMEVNFFAPVELTRLAMPYLMSGEEPVVVNVASMCGRKAMPAWPEYSASKFALVGISEAWRAEFVRFGVDVITIIPGMTNSGFQDNWLRKEGKAKLDFAQGMSPDFVAVSVCEAIRKNRSEVVLGTEAKRLLRFNRYFPKLTDWLIARKIKKLYSE
ncbi:MAG: SDR family NAD(P)-dependent oxidoreductase [Gemmataceae bacterium]|nr:SDR family NAD(P)-dependent oxidoreductase [Gemmata sp.]MDW8196485.1 SDR family NAD(P)-dependent oxidoreductase [Gemmataceae bacterium]